MSATGQKTTIAEAAIAEAMSWLGTPYRHQGARKGVGCDCLGLVRGVWRALYRRETETPGPYAADWAEAAGGDPLMEAARRHCRERFHNQISPGDVLIFRWRPGWMRRAWTGRETIRFAVPAADRAAGPGGLIRLPAHADGEFTVTGVEEGIVRKIEARRTARLAPFPDRSRLPTTIANEAGMPGKPLAIFLDLPLAAERPANEQFRVALFARPWKTQQVFASPGESGFEHRTTVSQPAVVGELVAAVGPGFSGRIDHAVTIDVKLLNGELSSVANLQLLGGANAAAIRSTIGVWEIVQFGEAEEIGASVWRLSGLLRGQLGAEDAALAGADAGADFVLLDDAVQPAGLRPGETGLELNWRAGPAGYELSDRYFAASTETGGLRALTPLSPVHPRAAWQADGSLALSWIRRGRIDADSWLGGDVPLGEASEAYRIEIGETGGAAVRTATADAPQWTYAAASFASDFPLPPAELEITVSQISAAVGDGLPARLTVTTATP